MNRHLHVIANNIRHNDKNKAYIKSNLLKTNYFINEKQY